MNKLHYFSIMKISDFKYLPMLRGQKVHQKTEQNGQEIELLQTQ